MSLVPICNTFYKNQIFLAEPQCSYCFSKYYPHLLLFYFCGNYTFWPCITHMYITHMFWLVSRKNFVLKYSNSCISPFVYWRNHRLCCSWRFWWHRPYFIVKFLLNLCILVIHYSFVCQVSIDLNYFSPFKFFWVLASSLVIVFKLFLIFG